jgi:rubrerythrin
MESFSVKKAIELAIKTEKTGVAFYTKAAGLFAGNETLAQIFNQLAKDEVVHEQQFTGILEEYVSQQNKELENVEETYLLQATSVSEFFKQDFLTVEGEPTAQDVLVQALNFEKSSLLHYIALNDIMKNNSLEMIIEAEKQHTKALMKVLLTEAKFRGLDEDF